MIGSFIFVQNYLTVTTERALIVVQQQATFGIKTFHEFEYTTLSTVSYLVSEGSQNQCLYSKLCILYIVVLFILLLLTP